MHSTITDYSLIPKPLLNDRDLRGVWKQQ